ncbi:UDP-N-acetylmuramate--L-alanine ligase [Actinoplanes sp. NBRC 103695]|uniref:UDP-N-acetylmuramate--L-alanine ligase n=1 Tax=Actinoplanes sp. NBRC 103695 TaxID=3032202 RepID=UPI002556A453|nr:UDP-N-acetylmuramate--L-alanine ligase [Actinoplanes sp. NBRC 103695]
MTQSPQLADLGRIHFVGVGGYGMSGLAEILAGWGHDVSGSDTADVQFARLREAGVTCVLGHDPAVLAGVRTVIATPSLPAGNVEVDAARERGLAIMSRGELLDLIARQRQLIAVAGSHGKTTTSGMLTLVMLAASGADPTYSLGGYPFQLASNGHGGSGPWMVAEINEGDGTFGLFRPRIAVITNVDPDHLELFGTAERYVEAFQRFAEQVDPDGVLVVCADDPRCRELADDAGKAGRRVVTYGSGPDADVVYRPVQVVNGLVEGEITVQAQGVFPIRLSVPGVHNLQNAAAVMAVADALDLDLDLDLHTVAEVLGGYQGAQRRLERLGRWQGIEVIDDYAHHPTEMAVVIALARQQTGRHVVVCLRPLRFARTQIMAAEIAQALARADHVVVMDPTGDTPIDGVTGAALADRVRQLGADVVYADGTAAAIERLAAVSADGDVVLTIGAHDVAEVARGFVATLQRS